jgi:hypothetical protein
MTTTLKGAAAAAIVATALISAPVASADNESGSLGDLNIDHANLPGKTPAETVAAGYATCHHLESGTAFLDEINAVNTTYGFDHGGDFVSLASTYLCPNWASQ